MTNDLYDAIDELTEGVLAGVIEDESDQDTKTQLTLDEILEGDVDNDDFFYTED